jgi:hypothetical protein
MHEKYLYEYAVIRVVPRVEREEFINVGIILFCKNERYINVLFQIDFERLQTFSNELDCEQLEQNLKAFEAIAKGVKTAGPIALEGIPERFRWLTAVRSSVIQTSRPHPGKCSNLELTIQRLLKEYVG